jgi:hypothetical protein
MKAAITSGSFWGMSKEEKEEISPEVCGNVCLGAMRYTGVYQGGITQYRHFLASVLSGQRYQVA